MPQSLTRVVDILSYLLHSGSWVCLVFLILFRFSFFCYSAFPASLLFFFSCFSCCSGLLCFSCFPAADDGNRAVAAYGDAAVSAADEIECAKYGC